MKASVHPSLSTTGRGITAVVSRLSGACVIAVLASCTHGPRTVPAVQAEAGPARQWKTFYCQGETLQVAFDEGSARLRRQGTELKLSQTPSASGARYFDGQDMRVGLWSKGEQLAFSTDGETWTGCDSAAAFQAWGQEPSWRLVIENERGELLRPGLGEPLLLRIRSLQSEGDATVLGADSADGTVSIRIDDGLCRDIMSGMVYPQTVAIDLPNRQLRGCGGDPAKLLRAQPWALRTAVAGRELAVLAFEDAGRFSLQAPCNRHLGTYVLTGEGLSLTAGASTRIGCPADVEQEDRRLLDALRATTRFDVDDQGLLNLIGPQGLLLQAQPAPLM